MAKLNDVGVIQKSNGFWEYRFVMVVDGVTINRKKSTDAFGNKLKTKKDAVKAREAAMTAARTERQRQRKISRRTVKEIFEEYRKEGCTGKAYQTLKKQDSLWKNHFCGRWGSRYIDDISVAEINDYLADLYYEQEYSFRYVESFLKVFYLIFGQAYSRNLMMIPILSHSAAQSWSFWTNTLRVQTPKQRICWEDTAVCVSMKPSA